jgi:hypothetical protein
MLTPYATRIAGKVRTLAPWNKDNGLVWYNQAHAQCQELSDRHGVPLEKVAAIVAVLSPGTAWERNIRDAESIIQYREQATVTTYGANKAKACAILDSSNYYQFVRGNKVQSFHSNILYPETSESVTLDRHMLRFILKPRNDKELNKIFSSSRNYQAIASRIRRKAHKMNIRPCQLQAMLWLEVRP